MKTMQILLVALLLTACSSEARAPEPPQIGTLIGRVGPDTLAYTFRTPEGAYCVLSQSTYTGAPVSQSCDFSQVRK